MPQFCIQIAKVLWLIFFVLADPWIGIVSTERLYARHSTVCLFTPQFFCDGEQSIPRKTGSFPSSRIVNMWSISEYANTPKPGYHTEQLLRVQKGALCGVHCLNALLQGPCFSARGLANIARAFDEQETILMAQQGLDTPEFRQFFAEESGNDARDGMFSIQVSTYASAKLTVQIRTAGVESIRISQTQTVRDGACRFSRKRCLTGTSKVHTSAIQKWISLSEIQPKLMRIFGI